MNRKSTALRRQKNPRISFCTEPTFTTLPTHKIEFVAKKTSTFEVMAENFTNSVCVQQQTINFHELWLSLGQNICISTELFV